jgi:hypothetical protein
MKAMIWKEWRENAKWALLAFLALGLATLYATTKGFDSSNSQQITNLFEATTTLTMFVVPLFASALGALQVGTELRRDQWAFLLHRPVSRTTIFAGKVIAGLSLYLLATLTPTLILALWMRTPGNLAAPFDWRFLFAPMANILVGITFYFCGMLAAVRPARWYGSRAIGFAMAFGCLVVVNMVPEFWQASGIALLGGVLLGLAAWGSFLTTGTYGRQPRVAKIALGITMLVSLMIVVGGLAIFTLETVVQGDRQASYQDRPPYEAYMIDKSGRILKVSYVEGFPQSATDLQGRTVSVPRAPDDNWSLGRSFLILRRWRGYDGIDFRSTSRYYLRLLGTNYYNPTDKKIRWFWVKSERRIVGYSPISRALIGSVGPQGFSPIAQGLATPFPEPIKTFVQRHGSANYGDIQCLSFAHSVYVFNLNTMRMTRIYEAVTEAPLQGVDIVSALSEAGDGAIALADANTIRVFGQNGRLLFATPFEIQDTKNLTLTISATPKKDRFFLWYEPRRESRKESVRLDHISEFSSNGVLLAKHKLPLLKKPDRGTYTNPLWYEMAAPVLVPPIAMTAATAISTYTLPEDPAKEEIAGLVKMRWLWLLSLVAGLVYAGLTLRLAKRSDLSPRTCFGWAIASFALGLFGALTLLALHEWPTLLACPHCDKKRSVNHRQCEHCAAVFPEPVLDDTAIFDDPAEELDLQRKLQRV